MPVPKHPLDFRFFFLEKKPFIYRWHFMPVTYRRFL